MAQPCLQLSPLCRPRDPQASDLWRLIDEHFDSFHQVYDERFQVKYGYWRPIVEQSVAAFLKCGDLQEGFARVRCPDCKHRPCKAWCPVCRLLLQAADQSQELTYVDIDTFLASFSSSPTHIGMGTLRTSCEIEQRFAI